MNEKMREAIKGAVWSLNAYTYAEQEGVRMFQNGADNSSAFQCTVYYGNNIFWIPGWYSKWPRTRKV